MKTQTIQSARLTLDLQRIAQRICRARNEINEQGHAETELDLALQMATEAIKRFEPLESQAKKPADRIIAIQVRGNVIDIARLLDMTKKVFKGREEKTPL